MQGRHALTDFRNLHRGDTVVVCGCGESLTRFEHPERFLTIGVNDVGRQFDPTYLVVLNPSRQFAGDRFRYVQESRARYLFTHLDLGVVRPPVVPFVLGRYGGTDVTDSRALPYTSNSPYVAVCLAAFMGARRIGLIGIDFTDHHFFARTGSHPLVRRFSAIDQEYRRLFEALRAHGIDVVNLSPTSRLTAAPRVDLHAFTPSTASAEHAAPDVVPAVTRASRSVARVFFVNYRFLACGDVFATGLERAAHTLGIEHRSAWWDDAALAEKLDSFAPDLVFVVHGRRAVKRWAQELGRWNTAVWLVDEPYEVDDTAQWSSRFDTVFVNDPATLSRHRNAHCLPTCFDPVLHCDTSAPRDHAVGFIGGYNPVRERYLARLADEQLLSYVVGGPWKVASLRRLTIADRTTPAATSELYQRTRIVINVFRSVHHFNQSGVLPTALNPRVFEALACGAFVVSEPRPALASAFPEVPTFSNDTELVDCVRSLLADPDGTAVRLAASRAQLTDCDYTARLATVLSVTLGNRRAPRMTSRHVPAGWEAIGSGVVDDGAGVLRLTGVGRGETGLGTIDSFDAVRMIWELRLDQRCEFVAKIHQAVRGSWRANSYHLVARPQTSYVARHHLVIMPVTLPRDVWCRLEMAWKDRVLTLTIDGQEAFRSMDATLPSGYCFLGVTSGTAEVRGLRVDHEAPATTLALGDWLVAGAGTVTASDDRLVLCAAGAEQVSLVGPSMLNDVELDCSICPDDAAHLIVKVHHQSCDHPDSNSYHVVSTPRQGYLARHRHVFASVGIARRVWQRLRMRWIDQRLELLIDDRLVVQASDNLLQSGCCVVGVAGGRIEVRGLTVRDLSPALPLRHPPKQTSPRPGRDTLPFTRTPRRNLLYHVWPVRGETWRWNVAQIRSRIDLFNGQRIVAIVHDRRSEHPDDVRRMFDGCGCEFMVVPNGPSGEGLTFPAMLERVRSLDENEVSFYAHAKGVKYEPSVPPAVKRWAEAQYRVGLDDWRTVRAQLERFAMTGCFKMLGRFRAHRYIGDWHYSGTFFWLRHAFVFARDVPVPSGFYGCVEAWPGVHFGPEETGCLLLDGLRQLPYRPEFWSTIGGAAVASWEAARAPLAPPANLQSPPPFEGYKTPRLEQHPEEFAWFLDELAVAQPRHLLCIGSMHGGVEWHVARRFRELGRDIRITAVDREPRPELLATIADVRRRFNQPIELLVGDSASDDTRRRLGPEYDAVFIDGDHSYRGVRADVDLAFTRSARLVALHDIADSDWHAQAGCCVSRVWAELRPRYNGEECAVGDWGGIGILKV
jgi:spore maturation protein CgeB/predicted O-methyltransferase YrrM